MCGLYVLISLRRSPSIQQHNGPRLLMHVIRRPNSVHLLHRAEQRKYANSLVAVYRIVTSLMIP